MKLLIETTGPFMMVDYTQAYGLVIDTRPVVANSTQFVQTNIARGKLRVVAELPDEATDEAFVETLAGSKDVTVAVAAFKAEFDPKPEPEPEPAPQPKRGRK